MTESEDIELEIKRLERQRLQEELRQLRTRNVTQWITPATLLALVPLATGFGVFVWNEVKEYTSAAQKLAAAEAILQRNDDLEAQLAGLEARRAQLNTEITSLIAQYGFYLDQAREFQARFEAREHDVERAWTGITYAAGEMGYTLSHVRGLGPEPDLEALRDGVEALPPEFRGALSDRLQRYETTQRERNEMTQLIIGIAEDNLGLFDEILDLLPVPERVARLAYRPTPMGKVLAWPPDAPEDIYDIGLGRFLTDEERAARE